MDRVLIVASYLPARKGLLALLGESEEIDVVGAVRSRGEMEEMLPTTCPDVVLLDTEDEEAAEMLALLSRRDIGLVVLTDQNSRWNILTGSALRGWALLRREAEGRAIVGAVRAAASGLVALDRGLERWIMHEAEAQHLPMLGLQDEDTLSAREREVLQLMTLGLPNKQIAGRLSISLSTAKFHVAAILAKLGASSRTEAVTLGIRRGDVSL